MAKFQAHGTLDVHIEGRLLIIEGTGPWNSESVLETDSSAKPIVSPLYGAPWGVIATIRGIPVYVPQAARQLEEIVREDIRNGRVATALLVEGSDSPLFAENHIGEIYQRAGDYFRVFTDHDEARKWVLDEIAKAQAKAPK